MTIFAVAQNSRMRVECILAAAVKSDEVENVLADIDANDVKT